MSDDRQTQSSHRPTMLVGTEEFQIRDHTGGASYVDAIVESAASHGTVMLSLGSFARDIPGGGFIDINHRIRMNLFAAKKLHAVLGKIIEDVTAMVEQQNKSTGPDVVRHSPGQQSPPDAPKKRRVN
jgi:hypothetical protein